MPAEPMTISTAVELAALIQAVRRNDNISIYQDDGNGSPDYDLRPLNGVLRAFTHDGGNFWHDNDGDIRNARVWISGMMEHWPTVGEILTAMKQLRVEFEVR